MQKNTVRFLKYMTAYVSGFFLIGYFWAEFKGLYILYQQEKSSENLIYLYEGGKISKEQADNEKKLDITGLKTPSHKWLLVKHILKYLFFVVPLTILTWPFMIPLVLIPSIFSIKSRLKASEFFQSFGIEPYAAEVYDSLPVFPKVTKIQWVDLLGRLGVQKDKPKFDGCHSGMYETHLLKPQHINLFLRYLKNHEYAIMAQLQLDKSAYTPIRISKEQSGLPFTIQITIIEGELALIADVKSKVLLESLVDKSVQAVKTLIEPGAGNYNTVKKSLRLDREQILADRVCEQDAPLGTYSYKNKGVLKTIMVSKQRLDKNPHVYHNNALEISKKKREGVLSYYAGAVYRDRKVNSKKWSLYSDYKSKNLEEYLKTTEFQQLTTQEKILISEKIIEAILSLHKDKIVYVDIKFPNILIDENKNIYLVDFDGSARVGRSIPKNPIVTWVYAAPELIKRYESLTVKKEAPKTLHLYPHFRHAIDVVHQSHFKESTTYQLSADSWSLGCLLERILQGTGIETADVLQNCFNPDAGQRATMADLYYWIAVERQRCTP